LRAVSVAAAALALLTGGCGGDGEPSEAYRVCQLQTENTARADAVRFAYEQGRLGTQAELDADFPGDQSIFDDEGSMLTYEGLGALRGLTQARFNEWVATDDYLAGPVQLEASAAKDRVADEGWPDCEDLK